MGDRRPNLLTFAAEASATQERCNKTTLDQHRHRDVAMIPVRFDKLSAGSCPTFMSIPAELRIQIYEQLFYIDVHSDEVFMITFMSACPIISPWLRASTPFGKCQSTSILLVNRQVYQEALPIMWANVKVLVNGVRSSATFTPAACLEIPFNCQEKAITMIQEIAISKSISAAPTPYRRDLPDYNFQSLCEKLKCASRLKILRLHLDIGHTTTRSRSCIRQLAADLDPIVSTLDNVTVLLACHFDQRGVRSVRLDEGNEYSEAICEDLQRKANDAGKRIFFKWPQVVEHAVQSQSEANDPSEQVQDPAFPLQKLTLLIGLMMD